MGARWTRIESDWPGVEVSTYRNLVQAAHIRGISVNLIVPARFCGSDDDHVAIDAFTSAYTGHLDYLLAGIFANNSMVDAIEIGNGVAYGLSASIYTRDVNKAFTAMRDMYTGIFYVNAPTIGAEVHLPFGGTKATGNGHREAGTAALDVFSEWKSIYVDFSGKLQRAQIDT